MSVVTIRHGVGAVTLLGIGLTLIGLRSVQAQTSGLPGTIERCQVIAQEMTDYDNNTRLVFERFCELMYNETAPSPAPLNSTEQDPPEYFVKCVVAGDPDWIGFRLVTRDQCDAMQGAEIAQKERGFGPK